METPLNWQELLLVLVALCCFVNTLVVGALWLRHEAKRDRLEHMDRRMTLLEERVGGMAEVRQRLSTMSGEMAALNERSESTLEMVQTIQTFLMESGNGKRQT